MGVSGMDLHESVSTQLPKAVIASIVITLFNIYTDGMTSLVRLSTEFFLYTLAIFVGFVVFSVTFDGESDDRGV
jgi:hypothetical protein